MLSGRLAVVAAGAVLGAAPMRPAFAAENTAAAPAPPPRIRVAVAFEQEPQLAFPPEFGPHAATRALAQGVREACLPVGAVTTTAAPCAEIGDAPGSRVCVDETAARALGREIECAPTDASAEAIELAGSACETTDCFQGEARRAGASHLLLVAGTWRDGFTVAGTMTSVVGAATTPVAPRPGYNPQRPRTGPQVLAILKWVARDAIVGELGREREARLARPAATPPVPIVTAPIESVPAVVASERVSHKAVGWTLIATGVAAGAASGWFFAADKADTDCAPISGDPEPCSKVRRTLVPAIGLGVGAAAALLGGLVLVLRNGGSGDATVAVSARPDGVSLGGTF